MAGDAQQDAYAREGRGQGGPELFGRFAGGWRHVNEIEEAIEPEDDKDQPEEDACNDGSDFHERKLKGLPGKDKGKNTTTGARSEEAIRLATA